MATAKGIYSEPVLNGVTLTLTLDQAEQLTKFLGKTQLLIVQDLLSYETETYQKNVNDTLYEVYEVLNSIIDIDY